MSLRCGDAQLDLLEPTVQADHRWLADGALCLAEAHPRALELLVGLRAPDRGGRHQGGAGRWVFSVRREGLYVEDRASWTLRRGWTSLPAGFVSWDELDIAVGGDERVEHVRCWSNALRGEAVRDRVRPFALWPDPGQWHQSYVTRDRSRVGWIDRM